MSSECLTINESVFNDALQKFNEYTNKDFEKTINDCPQMGGNKMVGGFSKKNVKYAIYIILSILAGLSAFSSSDMIISGLNMIISGQCGYLINRLFFQHPLCAYWNELINKVTYALRGDRIALAQLTAVGIGILQTPQIVDGIVDRVAEQVSNATTGQNTITNEGGKKSRRRVKKARKSRKTRKNKKSRKHRKSKK
jgi:hypothetical protein